MNLVQRIRNLCNSKGMTFAELERTLGFSNGQSEDGRKPNQALIRCKKLPITSMYQLITY